MAICNIQEMNWKSQNTQPLQVVNLSEGWAPVWKVQSAYEQHVVNLSEGCNRDADVDDELVFWMLVVVVVVILVGTAIGRLITTFG